MPACPLDLNVEERAHLAPLVTALLRAEHPRAPRPWGLALWLTTSNTDGRGDVRDGDDRILRFPAR